eukprot:1159475-Pelagomonas_calceolata.AAC.10
MGNWRVVHHAPGRPDSPSPALHCRAPSIPPRKPFENEELAWPYGPSHVIDKPSILDPPCTLVDGSEPLQLGGQPLQVEAAGLIWPCVCTTAEQTSLADVASPCTLYLHWAFKHSLEDSRETVQESKAACQLFPA